ncbi:MAG: hypothetical protein HY823_11180 [Acidobacteria bacterium]|nr:hypothetical protein [Acidobacteriota bacterium]
MRIHLDKISSVTRNLHLQRTVTLSPDIEVRHGAVVAGRILNEKHVYNHLEDPHGRMSVLHQGDIVVGALGHRNALQGYEGVMPERVVQGERLHLLNLGGVLGRAVSANPDVGPPFEVEVLGQVLAFKEFGSRKGEPAHIGMGALAGRPGPRKVPVVFVMGTCMNAGKTHAACAMIRRLTQAGLRVGGAKLTGVALMRDILAMQDYGAEQAFDFTDAGVACTSSETAPQVTRTIFSELAASGVDLIVAETGDGILGEYGVQAILADEELRGWGQAFVLCANDPVGVAGGVEELRRSYGIAVSVVAGPATDNQVGVRFVERAAGLPGINARTSPLALGSHILGVLGIPERGLP